MTGAAPRPVRRNRRLAAGRPPVAPTVESRPMKKSLLTAFALAGSLLLATSAVADAYGKALSAAQPVKVSELVASPDKYVGKVVKVEGLVTEVCAKRGCWMNVAGDKEFQTIRIKVDDGVIVFPLSAKGKKAVAEGTFKKIELTKEQALDFKKHMAEEAGVAFDPKSVTSGMTIYQIKGTGATIN
jgi:hypothetical protein